MAAEPAIEDIEIFQGAYWEQTLLWKDADDVPVDLTGYDARMQIRKKLTSAEPVIELTVTNGRIILDPTVGYNILLKIAAADTAALPATPSDHRWYYDLELVPAGGQVRRLMMGRALVSIEVTR